MLSTSRLTMRPFRSTDQDFLFELNNDKAVNQYRSGDHATKDECKSSIETWQKRYKDGLLNVYIVELKEVQQAIGLVALFKRTLDSQAELGYRLLPKYWHQGYCKEAARCLIERYFNQSSEETIFAETHPDNINSIRFLEQNKFVEKVPYLKDRGKIYITHKSDWL